MQVNGIGPMSCPAGYGTKTKGKHIFEKGFLEGTKDKEMPGQKGLPRQVPLTDIYGKMKSGNRELAQGQADGEGKELEVGHPSPDEKIEGKTSTEIIVKPDGSRVLVMTMHIGGMETTMSLEISKPTDLPNGIAEEENGDSGQDMGNTRCQGMLSGNIG